MLNVQTEHNIFFPSICYLKLWYYIYSLALLILEMFYLNFSHSLKFPKFGPFSLPSMSQFSAFLYISFHSFRYCLRDPANWPLSQDALRSNSSTRTAVTWSPARVIPFLRMFQKHSEDFGITFKLPVHTHKAPTVLSTLVSSCSLLASPCIEHLV